IYDEMTAMAGKMQAKRQRQA
ncbi:hypothetical protein N0592_04730, partial [Pseudomonas aeruginosa]|nr:hypothetical protein [Pseudomonas aeruginosa]